jgi:hypothetical protein
MTLTSGPGTLRRLQDGIATSLRRTVFRRACGAANVGHRLLLFSDAAAGTDVVQKLQSGCGRARDRSHILGAASTTMAPAWPEGTTIVV